MAKFKIISLVIIIYLIIATALYPLAGYWGLLVCAVIFGLDVIACKLKKIF